MAIVIDDAAIVIGERVVGIDLERMVVVGDGAVVVALVVIGVAAIVIGQREIRADQDRLVVVLIAVSVSPLLR